MQAPMDAASHYLALLKEQAYALYLSVLFSPARHRAKVLGLLGFHYELSQTLHKVTDPMLGQIRFQWWHDRLQDASEGRAPEHPLFPLLQETCAEAGCDYSDLQALIPPRMETVSGLNFSTTQALETYLQETWGQLFVLVLTVCEGSQDQQAIARTLGLAVGLDGIGQALTLYITQRLAPVPQEWLESANIDLEQLTRKSGQAQVQRLQEQLYSLSAQHLNSLTLADIKNLPPALQVQHYLALQRQKHPSQQLRFNTPLALLRLYWHVKIK